MLNFQIKFSKNFSRSDTAAFCGKKTPHILLKKTKLPTDFENRNLKYLLK